MGMYIRVLHADARGWWVGRDEEHTRSVPLPAVASTHVWRRSFHLRRWLSRATSTNLQLSAMDVSVRSTMKGAAKCDKHCELQISVSR